MRVLTLEEKDLWELSNQSTKKLSRNNVPLPPASSPQKRERTKLLDPISPMNFPQGSKDFSDTFSQSSVHFGVDKILPKKAKNIVIEGSIDLHGLTRTQAQDQLLQFLLRGQVMEKRWVRVITGKSGVLRIEVPQWLEHHSFLVSGYTHAPLTDGGVGALYVRLRRIEKVR